MDYRSCLKKFIRYVSLNILGMIGLSCYILVDTFFIARKLGADGLTSLNLAIPVFSLIHGVGIMLGMGGATQYSLTKGEKNEEKGNQIFTTVILLGFVFAVLFFILGLFFSGGLIRLLGADETVYQMSRTYLQIILLFAPLFIYNNILISFVRNDGNPRLSMVGMLGGSIANIILDYIFMYPMGMGIFGAVIATGFSPIISMLILSTYLLKGKRHFHLIKCRIRAGWIRSILSLGLPSFVTELSSGIVILVFNAIILRLEGNTGVAAYGIIANISLVVVAVYTGIAQGVQPLMSQYYGTGNYPYVKTLLRYSLITLLFISGSIYAAIFFHAPWIAGIFNKEGDVFLQNMAVNGLKIYFFACLFVGFNIIVSVYFTSTNTPRPAHIISMLRGFIIIIPLAFLLSSVGGMRGIWCVFPLTELIVSGIGLFWLIRWAFMFDNPK